MFSSKAAVLLCSVSGFLAFGAAFLARAAAPRGGAPAGYTRNVAIVLCEGVELLDFAGPGEVFAAAADEGASGGRPAFRVYTVAASKAPLTSQGFLTIVPDHSWDDAPAPDIIVIPGGNSRALVEDPKFMAWVERSAPKAEISLSVCTGAFALAKAGLLDGASATTWYGAIDRLRAAAPKAAIVDGRRFVDNGSTVTTAGVSAGINGSLHVVARLLGRHVADRTARYMEYHWTPEAYLAQAYSSLNPSLDERGRRLQQAQIFDGEKRFADSVAAYKALVAEDPKDGSSWFRLACAYAQQGKKDEALRSLEDAVAAGFKDRSLLESEPDLAGVRDDPRFRALLESL